MPDDDLPAKLRASAKDMEAARFRITAALLRDAAAAIERLEAASHARST